MADETKLDVLKKQAEAAFRYYNLLLKEQDRVNDAIDKGAIASFEDLSRAIAGIAKKDLPSVRHNIIDATRELEKMGSTSDKISDSLISSREKLQAFLRDTKTLKELKTETYKIQRRALSSDALSVEQMKKALAITTKELRLKTKAAGLSTSEVNKQKILLDTLKNAGDISPEGIKLIEDTALSKIEGVKKMLTGTVSKMMLNADAIDFAKDSYGDLTKEMKTYNSLVIERSKLKSKLLSLPSSGLDPKSRSEKSKEIGSKIKSIDSTMGGLSHSSYSGFAKGLTAISDKISELQAKQKNLNKAASKYKNRLDKTITSMTAVEKSLLEQLNMYKKLYDEATSINEKSKLLIEKMQGATEINKDQIAFYRQMVGLLDAQKEATGETADVEYKMFQKRAGLLIKADKIHDDIQDKIKNQYQTLSDIASLIPGIGPKLSDAFDNARDKVSLLASDMYQQFSLTFSKTGNASQALGDAMSVALGRPGAKLAMALGAAVVVAAVLYGQIRKLSRTMEEVSSNTGLTASQAFILEKSALRTQIRFDNMLASMEDLRAAQKGIVNEAGFFLKVQNDVLNTVTNTGRAFGYGAELAGQLQTELMQVSGGSEILAANTQVALASIGEAVGLAPGLVAKDIVENSELVARYFTGYPRALANTVIEIQKMGLSLLYLKVLLKAN
jgi:predicted  nucleic acid-binding Zn-ribbon protein